MQVANEDEVLRARVSLLASWRLSLPERVEAYRVLARVSPDAYAPKPAERLRPALDRMGATPERREELAAEAVEVARLARTDHPRRIETLRRALAGHQRELFALGRRTEALGLHEELAAPGGGADSSRPADGRSAEAGPAGGAPTARPTEAGRYAEAGTGTGAEPETQAEAEAEEGRYAEAVG